MPRDQNRLREDADSCDEEEYHDEDGDVKTFSETTFEWIETHVPMKTLTTLCFGVVFAEHFKESYANTVNYFGPKSYELAEYASQIWSNMSNPEMTTAIALRMPMAVSAPMIMIYGILCVVLGCIVFEKIRHLTSVPKYTRENIDTNQSSHLDSNEVEPNGEFEVALIEHGYKKIKKHVRKRSNASGFRITHRFISPTQVELAGKTAARQYLRNMSYLP